MHSPNLNSALTTPQEPVDDKRSKDLTLNTLLLVVILLATWLPRGMALDRFVTPDENLWITRSANFYFALGQRNFGNTFQRQHPGVTVMWAGTAGFLTRFPEYRGTGAGQIEYTALERYFRNNDPGFSLLQLLAAARQFMVIGHTLILGLAFFFALGLFGRWTAFLGFLFIALDPFHIGLTRLLHLDGMLSNLMLLSLLAFLSYLQFRSTAAFLASAVAAGLSWLTKSPGFFLIPIVGILLLVETWREARFQSAPLLRVFWRWTIVGTTWVLIGLLVFVILWPSMWVDPLGSLGRVLGMARTYAAEGHGMPVFFNGQLFEDGGIGPEYVHFYLYTFAWRSTPLVVIGLLLALVLYITRRDLFMQSLHTRTLIGLLLLVFIFYVIMTLGTKKFDRYFLPAHGPLILLAAAGWTALVRWLTGRFGERIPVLRQAWALPAAAILIAVINSPGALQTYPYYLSYYNPLLGGSPVASRVMQIGWGEGLDEAARYLNQKDNLDNMHVVSWYSLGSFSYFFKGRSHYIHVNEFISDEQLDEMLEREYAVIYIHQWQRHTPEKLLELLSRYQPEKTIWINGIEYVRIYNLKEVKQ